MMFRAAIALIAFSIPAFAQHGGARAGSSGSRSSGSMGSAGHGGFSGSPRFSQPGSFARPGQPVRYGAMGGAGFRGTGPRNGSSRRIPYNGNRFMAGRPLENSRDAGLMRTWDGGGDRDRDQFDARRRSFRNWYLSSYPAWLGYGYPYGLDSGFYDWGDSDNSADDQGGEYDQGDAAPDYPAPYPDKGYLAPGEQSAAAAFAAPSAPEQPLTLIFKSGRAPVKVQNYMMTATVLTDLDPQHYQQIPLDQIDLAATQQVNTAAGVEFQVPDASRE
jgi:hypothetical protein